VSDDPRYWTWDPIEHPDSHVHVGPLCYGEPVPIARPKQVCGGRHGAPCSKDAGHRGRCGRE
jgi:hypothetical protein